MRAGQKGQHSEPRERRTSDPNNSLYYTIQYSYTAMLWFTCFSSNHIWF